MQQLYQRMGSQTSDPSKGLIAATEATGKGLKEIISGISDMQKNQEGQIIQANTQQAADMFRQQIAQKGLGILADPPDLEKELRPFGNMIDKAAIAKLTVDFTKRLTDEEDNKASAIGDAILTSTGDPIQAREGVKKYMISRGAPSTFADTAASNFDLRKAAEIKNIATRENERFASATSDVIDMAAQRGVKGAEAAINVLTAEQPKEKQAAFKKRLQGEFNTISAPNEIDTVYMNETLKSFDNHAKTIMDIRRENLKQKNDQTLSVSSSNSNSDGSDSSRSGGSGIRKGKTGDDVVDLIGNRITNTIEKFSGSNDSVELRKRYRSISDRVGDRDTADRIFKDSFDYSYKGDGVFGNDLSKKDFETMDKRIDALIEEGVGGESNSGRTTSRSSYSKSGNVSFTSADAAGLPRLAAELQRKRDELVKKLQEAAINKKLGYAPEDETDNTDPLAKIASEYIGSPSTESQVTPTKSATPSKLQSKAVSYSGSKKRGNGIASNPFGSGNSGSESEDAEIARYEKILADREKAKGKDKSNVDKAKANIKAVATSNNDAVTTTPKGNSQSPIVNMFKRLMKNSSEPVRRGSRYTGTASKR